ncbi:hypothetical protein MDA_GLEAN10005603 [Myotis davidii]|uniref:Uncharacterized protein n=1 Tax=Myotis davidii TaxID=225400 RepID=L5M051_MYODS|nr:hypothetical protein MDA_GLEAN10005603 [Myotis davidii]
MPTCQGRELASRTPVVPAERPPGAAMRAEYTTRVWPAGTWSIISSPTVSEKILSSVALGRETLAQQKQVDSVKNTFGSHNAVRKTEGGYFSERKPRKDL